jgi:hypothetical protein
MDKQSGLIFDACNRNSLAFGVIVPHPDVSSPQAILKIVYSCRTDLARLLIEIIE